MGGGSHHHAWGSNRAFFVPVQQMGKLSSFQRISRNFNPNTVHVPKISAKLGRGTITCNRLYKKFPAWLYYGYRGYHASSYEFLENLREQKSWKPSQFVGPGLTEAQVLWTGKRAPFNYIQQWSIIPMFWDTLHSWLFSRDLKVQPSLLVLLAGLMHWSIWSFNIPPLPMQLMDIWQFSAVSCLCQGDGKFEQCLARVGNLTQKCQVFLTE